MNLRFLKHLRWVVSFLMLASFAGLFIDFTDTFPLWLGQSILYIQLLPSFLKFTSVMGMASLGFLLVFFLSAIFGRVYCSFLCPLGVFQDVLIRLRCFRRPVHSKVRSYNYIRYSVLVLCLVLLGINLTSLISFLDPYSNFGRICFHLIRPFIVWGNNLLASSLEHAGIYAVAPVAMKHISLSSVLFSSFFLLLLVVLTSTRGRLFCNTLCPVGSALGLFSNWSLFQIRIEEQSCTRCGQCEKVCKAGCIDSKAKSVDFSRCVSCYNCLTVCRFDSIDLKVKRKEQPRPVDTDARRTFLKAGSIFVLAYTAFGKAAYAVGETLKPIIAIRRKQPVTPPGSLGLEHFHKKCTSCHLCVSQCPSQVLQPSTTEYGWDGFMKPVMNFKSGFCNYNCSNCGHVCPTGAILPLKTQDKKLTQLGVALFVTENCIVYRKNKDCGACSEHCPTKAVRMVPYGDVYIPKVDPDLCIGCGACEHVCPAKPYLAIYVEGNSMHKKAVPPDSKPAAVLEVKKKKANDKQPDHQDAKKQSPKDSTGRQNTKNADTEDFPF